MKPSHLLPSLNFIFCNRRFFGNHPSIGVRQFSAIKSKASKDALSFALFAVLLTIVYVEIPVAFLMWQMALEHFTFGAYKIKPEEVFYSTQLSYAMVNLRPLLPGITLSPSLSALSMYVIVYICVYLSMMVINIVSAFLFLLLFLRIHSLSWVLLFAPFISILFSVSSYPLLYPRLVSEDTWFQYVEWCLSCLWPLLGKIWGKPNHNW